MYVHPKSGELYYMRLMLNEIRGATCYEDLRTVHGIIYATFKEACFALGLIGDDSEWVRAIEQAAHSATGSELRSLFVTILLNSEVSDATSLFENVWKILAEDISYRLRKSFGNIDYQIPEIDLRNKLLSFIADLLLKHSSTLQDHNLPLPSSAVVNSYYDRLFMEETCYDRVALQEIHADMFSSLNEQQKSIYLDVINSVNEGKGSMLFVYGSGGTGKTFLWKAITAGLRAAGKIVLTVASSGIASLLLPGGRTAHSRFKIPIDISNSSTCKIPKNSQLANLIRKTSLIIWDEAPMIHRYCIEAFSRTLQDILSDLDTNSVKKPFGGITVVFGGDFRQILPVIPSGSKVDILDATITSSDLWRQCKLLTLTTNMRLSDTGLDEAARIQLSEFAEWILRIGDGTIESQPSLKDQEGQLIRTPADLLVEKNDDPVASIISTVYQDFEDNFRNHEYLRQRAIVTPYNETVESINKVVLDSLPGDIRVYLSSDSIAKESTSAADQSVLYCSEFLNGLTFSGMPNHELPLKVDAVVMLLRNISPSEGLCNGTRLIITHLSDNVVEAEIISGTHLGHRVYIPRIVMSGRDRRLPFVMNRKQFPLRLSYGMTINKSQGQTLDVVGLFLEKTVFSHGQLYVALSRVTSYKGLKILILDSKGDFVDTTRNVVYKEVYGTIGLQ